MEEKQSLKSTAYSQSNFNLENKIASLNKIKIMDESDANLNQEPKFLDMRIKTSAMAAYSMRKMSTEDDWFNYSIGHTIGKKLKPLFKKTTPTVSSYLIFASAESFSIATYNAAKNWDGTLEYSTDAKNWTEWNGTTIYSANNHIYMRGKGNNRITGDNENYRWVLTGTDIKCFGNIENLLNYEIVAKDEHPVMAEYCYGCMFEGCTSLTTAPDLPATTLAASCYHGMFYNCSNLTKAPDLPATTLADRCYYYMFYGCTSLTEVPSLSATTLTERCYYHMFDKCTSLTTLPELPATILTERCYYYMFANCTSIKLSADLTDEYTISYRIPSSGTGMTATDALTNMLASTGGTFTGTPTINTIYYTSNEVV